MDALILKTSPYSESTLIVWLLTRDDGVVRALAKGARRLKGQTAAAFDLFAHVSVQLRLPPKHDALGIIRSADLKNEWMYLRRDLNRYAFASVGLEVLGAVAGASAPEPYFIDEALAYLAALEKAKAPGSLTGALMIRLLHHAGHPPQVEPAVSEEEGSGKTYYDFDHGIIVRRNAVESGGRWMPLTNALAKQLAPVLKTPPPLDDSFEVVSREGPLLLRWLVRVWEDHLHSEIKSWKFLEQTVLKK